MKLTHLAAISAMILASLPVFAEKPDFAYPKKVSENSEKNLREAIIRKDNQAIVRNLINYTLAESEISNKTLEKSLETINKTQSEIDDAATRALLTLIKADIYTAVYQRNRWAFNERKLPLTPLPSDFNEWSGDQFRHVVDSLLTDVTNASQTLSNVETDSFADVIDIDKDARPFFPTLFDFAAYKSLNLMKSVSETTPMFTPRWLNNDVFVTAQVSNNSLSRFGINTFRLLEEYSKGRPAVSIYTEINRLKWVYDNMNYSFRSNSDLNYRNEIFKLYEKYDDTPQSVIALLSLVKGNQPTEVSQKLYIMLSDYKRRFHDSVYASDVDKAIRQLTTPDVSVNFPSNVSPRREFTAKVVIKNSKKTTVSLYTATKPRNSIGRLIESRDIYIDRDGPFKCDTTVTFTVPDYGYYTIIPEADRIKKETRYQPIITASNMFATAISGLDNHSGVYVSDAVSGMPVTEAVVSAKSRQQIINSVKTDNDGYANLKNQGVEINVSKGNDRYLESLYVPSVNNDRETLRAVTSTSLPVYHLGDNAQWSVVVYNTTARKSEPAAQKSVTVMIRDANYQKVDSVTLDTDDFGRICGSTLLPKTGLTGYFQINVSDGKRHIGGGSFMVSDYKLPTFEAKVTEIRKDYPQKGDVTLTGKATTYSGFPVTDANVAVNVESGNNSRWYFNSFTSFYTTETTTDGNGTFSITLDRSVTDDAPMPDGLFKASFDVTSSSGETRSAASTFTLGKPFSINIDGNESFDIDSKIRLGISVVNPMLEKADIELVLKVLDNDSTVVATCRLATPDSEVDLTSLPTGLYTLNVTPADTALADAVTQGGMILYHASQRDFPIKKMIWTPKTNISFNSQNGSVLLGTDRDTLIVNMFISDNRRLIRHERLRLSAGLNKIDISLPDSINTASIDLVTVNNLNSGSYRIKVTTPAARERLQFSIGSFRDKVTPNATETWTFTTRYPSTAGISSAIMLNMFSQAINDICHQQIMSFDLAGNYGINLNSSSFYNLTNSTTGKWINPYQMPSVPTFNLYGLTWTGNVIRVRGRHYMSSAKVMSAGVEEDAMIESEEIVYAAADNAVMMKTAANGVTTEMKADRGDLDDAEEEAAESAETATVKSEYRPSEIPLALFKPLLSTDEQGKLSFTFTYPDASTTWILNAVAYDRQMHSASMTKSIVASHPLMVQGNIPRFLRENDTVVLQATVMNNTDTATDSIATLFEVTDMNDGSLIAQSLDTLSLAGRSSATVSLKLDVPANASSLIVRIKASTPTNSDGEQSAIAIMPASQRVIETYPFFMSPDSTTISLKVPVGDQSDVTLEFCENPIWTVVTALPGLTADLDFSTAPQAAAAIFSAAVADGIIRKNPEIGNALKSWLKSDRSDSTLVSMLERNADLKIALLNATPWVVDAMNDTQRMTRLALLFDRKEIDNVYASAIHTLARLQRKGGGWAWTEYGDESSEWATENVLLMNGLLSRLGFMPNDSKLRSMNENAVRYLDATVAKRKNNRGIVSQDMLYTYLRTLYPDVRQSTAASRVSAATVQDIISSWKSYPLAAKALSAQILESKGYHSTALSILKSLDEFSTVTPERGMWWDNLYSSSWWAPGAVATTSIILDAYAKCNPKSAAIDKIRQWLLLEKSRQDWGSSTTTSMVIASIMTTGTRWTASETPRCVVRVDNDIIEPDRFEKITGYVRADISRPTARTIDVRVDKVSKTPAYGAIYTSSTRTMSVVEAASVDGLSITKRFLVRRLTDNGEKWEETTSFSIGDVVKTTLTIKADVEMSYVAVIDNRPACLEPVRQLPERVFSQNICFYRETRNDKSSIFVDFLPKGTYVLEQEFTVNQDGTFSSGLATIQSQYAPQYTAHSAGLTVESGK